MKFKNLEMNVFKSFSELSKVRPTSAIFFEALLAVPEKITSSIPDPLILFAEFSPIHHLIDSTIFDLPHPFGPTMRDRRYSIVIDVFSTKDLNPVRSSLLNFIKLVISVFQ